MITILTKFFILALSDWEKNNGKNKFKGSKTTSRFEIG